MPADPVDWGAFDVVTDEKRLAILRALAERQREQPRDPALSFSALQERAGIHDSGNFNYHLGQLRERFVEKGEDGYRLTVTGMRMVATAVAESATPSDWGPTPLPGACPLCDTGMSVSYDADVVRIDCENGHVYPAKPVAPRLVADRDPERVAALVARRTQQDLERLADGVCFNCEGRMSLSPVEHEGVQPHFTGACADCGMPGGAPVVHFLTRHPAVVAFLHERGVDARERPFWAFDVGPESAVVESRDPFRVRVTVREDGDALHLTVDDDLAVVETAVETGVADAA